MAGQRILVVDDEAMVLESIRMSLAHFGYGVETASGASAGLTRVQEGGFDLVVTDRKMPSMSGEQFAIEVKKISPNLPVILLTGYPPEDLNPAIDAVLLKPFSLVELQNAIQSLIGKPTLP